VIPVILLATLFFFLPVQPVKASVNASCESLTISPAKTAYAPGETITVEIKGAGDVKNIILLYARTNGDLTSTNPMLWKWNTPNGAYYQSSKSWKGTLTLPLEDGEYLIAENVIDANNQICSGNPAYTCAGCSTGTVATTNSSGVITEVGKQACQGCQKVVVVDSNFGRTTGHDLKKYWNMSSGYSWNYDGTNDYSGISQKYKSRFSIEEKVQACGHVTLPWRFTKSNAFGYWMPQTPSVNVDGMENLRFLLTYFQEGESWSSNSMGALYSRTYHLPSEKLNPIAEIGLIYPSFNVNFKTPDSLSYSYNYFAPYLYAPSQFITDNYDFERVDAFYSSKKSLCSEEYTPSTHNHYWKISYIPDVVDTPAYKGPALRLMQVEGSLPPGSKNPSEGFGWLTREDWYLAEGVGIVQVDEYGGWCRNNLAECLRKEKPYGAVNSPLMKPPVQQKLTSYYVGQPLQITATPNQVPKNGKYTLNVSGNYTGFLEAKACVGETACDPGTQSFKWGDCDGKAIWVENGVATANLATCPNFPLGLHRSFFRPWVDSAPSGTPDETVITKTELPWSNEVLVRVTDPDNRGGALQITATPNQVPKNGKYTLNVSGNYTGFLEAKACVGETACDPGTQSFKWGDCDGKAIWVENGVATANLATCPSLPTGLHQAYFRPWSDSPKDEPWSNLVPIRVLAPDLQYVSNNSDLSGEELVRLGDLNQDTVVDLYDYNLLLKELGSTYSMEDYDRLVANLGNTY
ncbi:hypothetical protein KA012_04705, partial [Candidatus Woesebacteria bacterium]|nr:hypothetical protein [Candidatus Woesebacteria bacterium]